MDYIKFKKKYLLLLNQQKYANWHITDVNNIELVSSIYTTDMAASLPCDMSKVDPINIISTINVGELNNSRSATMYATVFESIVDLNTVLSSSQAANLYSDNFTVYDTFSQANMRSIADFHIAYYDMGQVISDVENMTVLRFTHDEI